MKLIKKPWFIPIILTIIIVAASQLYTNQLVFKADSLTEQEVRDQLENMYGAEVNQLTMKDEKYTAELTRNGGVYAVGIDPKTGKILSMVQLKDVAVAETQSNEEVVTEEKPPKTTEENGLVVDSEEDKSNSISTPPGKKKPVVLISEEKAIQIALSQLNGEVNDVDYMETTSGGYYLVEIEIDVDDGPDEATYQIHAISGEILTVAWDD